MQYIHQHTTTKTNIQRQNDPTTLEQEWLTTTNIPSTITTQRIYVRLDFAEKDFIELDQ